MNRKQWAQRKGRSSKWITVALRFAIYHRDNFRCVYCRSEPRYTGEGLTLDHVVTRSAGGTDMPDNLVTACGRCNSSRQARKLPERVVGRLRRHLSKELNLEVGRVMAKLRKIAQQDLRKVRREFVSLEAAHLKQVKDLAVDVSSYTLSKV